MLLVCVFVSLQYWESILFTSAFKYSSFVSLSRRQSWSQRFASGKSLLHQQKRNTKKDKAQQSKPEKKSQHSKRKHKKGPDDSKQIRNVDDMSIGDILQTATEEERREMRKYLMKLIEDSPDEDGDIKENISDGRIELDLTRDEKSKPEEYKETEDKDENDDDDDEEEEEEEVDNESYILKKFSTLPKNEMVYYNLLLEIRDKGIHVKLSTFQNILLAILRLKPHQLISPPKYGKLILSACRVYISMLQSSPEIFFRHSTVTVSEADARGRVSKKERSLLVPITQENRTEDHDEFYFTLLRALHCSGSVSSVACERVEELLLSSGVFSTATNLSTSLLDPPAIPLLSNPPHPVLVHMQQARFLGHLSHLEQNRSAAASPSSFSSLLDRCHLAQQRVGSFVDLLCSDDDLLANYSIHELNDFLRISGKFGCISENFRLFQRIKEVQPFVKYKHIFLQDPQLKPLWRDFSKLKMNAETVEFLVMSLMISVLKEEKSVTMKQLPPLNMTEPEVIVLGRSNVGKSSLINLVLNRKNLAKVSPIPGHTQAFHFFTIQRRLPWAAAADQKIFRLVDVPGLGYTDTVNSTTTESWKSLVIRYLSKRENCRLVLHLVDSRHLLTPIDKEIIRIAARTSRQRHELGQPPFRFAIVLTKVDKCKLASFKQSDGLRLRTKENPVDAASIEKIKEETLAIWSQTFAGAKSSIVLDSDEETDRLLQSILSEPIDPHHQRDPANRGERANSWKMISEQKGVEVIQTSSTVKSGVDSLWQNILAIFPSSASGP